MATQQAQFAETIRAMKLALKRKPDESDSDTSIHAHTNRGNKLKRRARFVREGRLDDTGGLAYRKRINHAGYTRNIISTNPTLCDEDGDLFSPNESDNEQRHGSPVEENAFGAVQLEHLLRPLTAASELPDHPSLSVAFKSRALTQMVDQALEMVRREKESLWRVKRLLGKLQGDNDWVPCGIFETEEDGLMLLGAGEEEGSGSAVPSVTLEGSLLDGGGGVAGLRNGGAFEGGGEEEELDGVEAMDMVPQQGDEVRETTEERMDIREDGVETERDKAETNGDGPNEGTNPESDLPPTTDKPEAPPAPNPALADLITRSHDLEAASSEHTSASAHSKDTTTNNNNNNNNNPPPHSMTTRARARSPLLSPSPSPTPSSTSIPTLHPWYLTPPSSLPGLPSPEGEEARKILLLYVQKRENIVRSLELLYAGLQRAERLRREVLGACKAEGHMKADGKGGPWVTEMSDGEDWYDPVDWGLGVGTVLEKGKDEEVDAEEEGRRGGRRRRVNRM